MSCDAVAFSAVLWLASFGPAQGPNQIPLILTTEAAAPASVAHEPLFMDIVRRARALKAQVETYRHAVARVDSAAALPNYAAFRTSIAELATLDMQGHTTLVSRGATDDLKCILRGISQDLPTRLQALESAATPQARDTALREMSYLLNDNVEVITSPPRPAA
jgi:hypothetical protein